MDTIKDFAPFRTEIDKLCATFDRPPAKDELVDAYWNSLRDVRFSEVQRNVQRIIRNATRETKWPKPGDLRDCAPEEGSRKFAGHEAALKEAERRCIRNWGQLAAQDRALHDIELAIAHYGRILATTDYGTEEHAEAVRLDRLARDQHRDLLAKREALT
jgi:hypothetical protein